MPGSLANPSLVLPEPGMHKTPGTAPFKCSGFKTRKVETDFGKG